MGKSRFEQFQRVIPLISPADITETATASPYVDLGMGPWCEFYVFLGTVTGSTGTVTLEVSTAASSNATEEAVGFNYRLSPVLTTTTDAYGDVTAATSDGVTFEASDDDKILILSVDKGLVLAKGEDYRYARIVITPASTAMSALEVAAWAVQEQHFLQNSIKNSTY